MNEKIMGINVKKTLKGLFSFNLKKRYLVALIAMMTATGGVALQAKPSTKGSVALQAKPSTKGSVALQAKPSTKKNQKISIAQDLPLNEKLSLLEKVYTANIEVIKLREQFNKEKGKKVAEQTFSLEDYRIPGSAAFEFSDFMNSEKAQSALRLSALLVPSLKGQALSKAITALKTKYQGDTGADSAHAAFVETLKNAKSEEANQEALRTFLNSSSDEKASIFYTLKDETPSIAYELWGKTLKTDQKLRFALIEFITNHTYDRVVSGMCELFPFSKKEIDDNHLRDVADAWIFNNKAPLEKNQKLTSLFENLLSLKSQEALEALHDLKAAPQYAGSEQVMLRNQTAMANSVLDTINQGGGSHVWLSPVGYLYNQKTQMGQITGSTTKTYGISAGLMSGQDLSVGVHGGYLHSNMKFENGKGKATLHEIHVGPALHYEEGNWFFDAIGDVSRTSVSGTRHLLIDAKTAQKIDEIYKYTPHSWNFAAGIATGYKFYLSQIEDLALVPVVKLHYVSMLQSAFDEEVLDSSADSAKAKKQKKHFAYHVDKRHSAYLTPRVEFKLEKGFNLENCRIAPAVRIGYLAYLPLTSGDYQVQQTGLQQKDPTAAAPSIALTAFNKTAHQLIVGGGLQIATKENFGVEASYEGNLGANAPVHSVLLNLNWKW